VAKEIPEHKDILGRVLAVGDHVAYAESNAMRLGRVDKLHPKMVRVTTGRGWNPNVNKYPIDIVKLDGPDLVMYLLKK
jgi:hypothetical protein